MKDLIHYKQLRDFVGTLNEVLTRTQKQNWAQKIFSKSFLKNKRCEKFFENIVIFGGCIAVGPLCYFAYTFGGMASMFAGALLLGVGLFFMGHLLWDTLFCSESKKCEIIQKLEKIVALHPQTEEIVAPVFLLLKDDISLNSAYRLETAINNILLNMEDENAVNTISVQTAEDFIQKQQQSIPQRFML